MMKKIWIILLLTPQFLYGGNVGNLNTDGEKGTQERRMEIEGQAIDWIHVAFTDYLSRKDVNPKGLREMKYYTFIVSEYNGNATVEILYHYEQLKRGGFVGVSEGRVSMVIGGGAFYTIDKKSLVVIDSYFYK